MYALCRSPLNYKAANTEFLNTYVCMCVYMFVGGAICIYTHTRTHIYTYTPSICLFVYRFLWRIFGLTAASDSNTGHSTFHTRAHTHVHMFAFTVAYAHTCMFAKCKLSTVCKHSSQMVLNAFKDSCMLFFLFFFIHSFIHLLFFAHFSRLAL